MGTSAELRIARLVATIALVLVLPTWTSILRGERDSRQVGSLGALASRTGWVPLGDVHADFSGWFSARDPQVDFATGTFTFFSRAIDRRTATLPSSGDHIRLTVDVPVYILEYETRGEERRLDPPLVGGRPLRDADLTGFWLPRGTMLRVHELSISHELAGARLVLARVTPTA